MSLIRIRNRNLLVDFLVILFGISAWVEINGIWVELPLLVEKLPEGWKLGSYIVIITQIANIGPISYSLLKRSCPGERPEKFAIHITLLLGTISCLLLTLFWDKTVEIGSDYHSLALLALTVCLGLVDCTSSVLYVPFMAYYKEKYLKSYFIGEGLSGLLPSIVALIQGVGGNPVCVNSTTVYPNGTSVMTISAVYPDPHFSVSAFFWVLFAVMVISWGAFISLNVVSSAKAEKVHEISFKGNSKAMYAVSNKSLEDGAIKNPGSKLMDAVLASDSEENLLASPGINQREFYLLLAIQAFSCCLTNGFLPSIQTYSTLPYGNLAHHFAITLSCIANPVACFIAMVLNCKSLAKISVITFLGTVCAGFIATTALESPNPPLVNTYSGEIIVSLVGDSMSPAIADVTMSTLDTKIFRSNISYLLFEECYSFLKQQVITWIGVVALLSYAKACVGGVLRQHGGHRALYLYGIVTQVGSAIGAISTFGLVSYTNLFQAFVPCSVSS